MGASALALSYNENNKVATIDIVNDIETDMSDIKNIDFYIGDVYEEDLIQKSDLILYDTTHDGNLEKEFHNHLVETEWKGICIWDDIKYGWRGDIRTEMVRFWDSIEQDKINITEYAHWTGTGMSFYNCDLEVKLR